MANTIIQLKHSTVTGNVPASLANGEISINSRDGKLFYSTPLGVVTAFNPYPGPSGLDTELQFNDSGVVGSDADLTFNKTTNILSAKNIVVSGNNYFGNANLHEGITQLSVTNSGASSYLFDQYSGDNPSLYVGAGETLSFNLNVSGHPFLIRESSGGANTSAGLTHISSTGVVSSGADAQGKVSGVLFWKVPFSLIGRTYVYQCQIHGGMVGNIVIQQPASFVAANTTLAFNTANSKAQVYQQNNAPSVAGETDFWIANTGVMYQNFGNTTNPVWAEVGPTGTLANTSPGIVNASQVQISGKQAVNGPAFRAYIDTSQTIPGNGVQTKTTFGSETFDTNSNFASSRFTPTVEGYYQLNATVRISGNSGTGECMITIWKNGSEYSRGTNESGTEQGSSFYSMQVSDIAYANGTGDYFEIYIQQASGGNRDTTAGTNISYFSGLMVRGA